MSYLAISNRYLEEYLCLPQKAGRQSCDPGGSVDRIIIIIVTVSTDQQLLLETIIE